MQVFVLDADLEIATGFRKFWQAQRVRLVVVHDLESALEAHDTPRTPQFEPVPKLTHHDVNLLLLLRCWLLTLRPAASPVLCSDSFGYLFRHVTFAFKVGAQLTIVNLTVPALVIKLENHFNVRLGRLMGENDSNLGNTALKLVQRDATFVHDVEKLKSFLQKDHLVLIVGALLFQLGHEVLLESLKQFKLGSLTI